MSKVCLSSVQRLLFIKNVFIENNVVLVHFTIGEVDDPWICQYCTQNKHISILECNL